MQLFLITYRFMSTAYCFTYYLLALCVKLTYVLLIDIGCAYTSCCLSSFAYSIAAAICVLLPTFSPPLFTYQLPPANSRI